MYYKRLQLSQEFPLNSTLPPTSWIFVRNKKDATFTTKLREMHSIDQTLKNCWARKKVLLLKQFFIQSIKPCCFLVCKQNEVREFGWNTKVRRSGVFPGELILIHSEKPGTDNLGSVNTSQTAQSNTNSHYLEKFFILNWNKALDFQYYYFQY